MSSQTAGNPLWNIKGPGQGIAPDSLYSFCGEPLLQRKCRRGGKSNRPFDPGIPLRISNLKFRTAKQIGKGLTDTLIKPDCSTELRYQPFNFTVVKSNRVALVTQKRPFKRRP